MLRFVFVLVFAATSETCLLCPFREPPRPRPLDQFKLPTFSSNFFQKFDLCSFAKSIPTNGSCHVELSKLLCSAQALINSYANGCPGPQNPKLCSNCSRTKVNNKWTVYWLDSLGKPPSGISDGNYYWLGDYETCVDLRTNYKFKSHYCRVSLDVPDASVEAGCPQTDPLAIIWGVCAPSACSPDELQQISEYLLPYPASVDCEVFTEMSFAMKIFFALTFLWMLFILMSTIAHLRNPDLSLFFYCFSLKVNGSRALSTKRDYGLHALQGMEFLVLCAIITSMVYKHMMPYVANVAFFYKSVDDKAMHFITNSSYEVDALLALSSLFATYFLLGELRSSRDILRALARKLIRFLPVYFYVIMFMLFVFPNIAAGPMWLHGDTLKRCSSSWWKNLLFINNFFGVRETCLDFGHIVSLEAQCFALVILLIALAQHSKKAAQICAIVLCATSAVLTFYLIQTNELPPAPMITAEPIDTKKSEKLATSVLVALLPRLSSYLIGFVYAFYFRKETFDEDSFTSVKNQARNKLFLFIFIVANVGLAVFVIFGAFPWAQGSHVPQIWLSFYGAFHRPVWAFVIISLLWLSHSTKINELNAFLSWRVFSPMSKLTYLILILIEPLVLHTFSALTRPTIATHWSTLYSCASTVLISIFFAFLLDIFIARPMRNLIFANSIHIRRCTIPDRSDSFRQGV